MTETAPPRGHATGAPNGLYRHRALGLCAAVLFAHTLYASEPQTIDDLKALSITELFDVPVTSVSRQPQKLSNAAAALFVITREDIRRAGVTSVPELLRMVPGIQVARIDANKWAISARGFNGRYSNKLLVQKDGRTLYSPLYSGVYWDVQDTLLDDIERIEVIRGPGATLWGANAVNGVINIITRSAHDTDGGLLSLSAGNEEHGAIGFRYGGALGGKGSYRVYAKGFERDEGRFFSGDGANDDWRNRQIGFRTDTDLGPHDRLTIQGDYYDGSAGATILEGTTHSMVDSETSGGNLLLHWVRELEDDAGIELKAYVDHTDRDNWTLRERRDTYDLDVLHYFRFKQHHKLIWGAAIRHTKDHISPVANSVLRFDPEDRENTTVSGFVQDNIEVIEDTLHLIIGTKVEHNDHTGWEFQPNVRGLWNLDQNTTVWAAISRAVRTPSRVESDVIITTPGTLVVGNDDTESERLTAFELGLRLQPIDDLSIDLAAFHNDYDRLSTSERVSPPGPPPLMFMLDNRMRGKSYGIELAANWDVSDDWRLKLAYSSLAVDLDIDDDSTDTSAERVDNQTPRHQFNLRSLFNLRHDLELDTTLFFVDKLRNTDVPSYLRLDVRLGWIVSRDIELSLSSQNLLDNAHPEFIEFSGNSATTGLRSTQAERSVLLQTKWRF